MNSYIVFLIFLQSVIFAQVSAQYTQNINAVMIGKSLSYERYGISIMGVKLLR